MPRKQKLKVYRTPIGFHDAYVAAPSQKSALEAWGSDADLFSRGIAEVVTDEELAREPLAKPGVIIKRLRGSVDEQLAALPPDRQKSAKHQKHAKPGGSGKTAHAATARPSERPKPRPPRDALDKAEREFEMLLKRQEREDEHLRERERAIERERRDLERDHERDRRDAEREVETERKAHAAALDRWIEDQS